MHVNPLRRLYWFARGVLLSISGIVIKRRPYPNPDTVKRVLVVALSRIGDIVYMTPVFREIKKHLPQVTIDLVCRSYTADVFKHNPHIENIFILPGKITDILRETGTLKKRNYSIAIDLTADDKINGSLITRLSGARYCIGYNVQKRGFCFDRPVPYLEGKLHATQVYLHLLEQIHIPVTSNQPEIFTKDTEREELNNVLQQYDISEKEIIIGLHPGANFPSQRLSEKKWAALCDIIQNKFHKRVVLFGGPKDYPVIEDILRCCETKVVVVDKLKCLRDAILLIDRCSILLCNNSGPLHIAEALGTATLSWMGPTIPHRWFPLGSNHRVIRKEVDCSPCNRGVCEHHTCEKKISLDEMEQEFKLLLYQLHS